VVEPSIGPRFSPVAGSAGPSALYRAQRLPDGGFAQPVDVGPPVNDRATGDAFVAPDESYVVFASGGRGGFGQGDLFVSFRQPDGAWGEPVNLGETVNTTQTEFCPMVTPDGRHRPLQPALGRNLERGHRR
jgi:hypothetical protein